MTDIACAVEARDALGESPIWCSRTGLLWWLDILKPCLQSFDPLTGRHQVHPLPGRTCGNLALRASGGFVLAVDTALHGYDPAKGLTDLLARVEPDLPENRFNDGRCDRRGRLWIGTMDRDIRTPSGSFYRIGADRSVQRLFGGVSVPNSTAFSPDNRTLYFADTPRHAIWAFDFDLDAGAISNRRVFADLSGRAGLPDGSCVDADGFLWNAEFAGHRIVRYAPDGRVDRTIEVPVTNPTCCCFGGAVLYTLSVTSAAFPCADGKGRPTPLEGCVLALDVGVRGLPEAAFAG